MDSTEEIRLSALVLWTGGLNLGQVVEESHPRIASLRERHAALDTAVSDEASRRIPDLDRLHSLKRQKLRLKDDIERFRVNA
jgi:hypothetical protein